MSEVNTTQAVLRTPKIRVQKKVHSKKAKSFLSKFILFLLLCGLTFIILFPFISKVSASFMSNEDIYDQTVSLIPRHPTMANYQAVLAETNFLMAALNTLFFAVLAGVLSVFSSCFVGYGLAKFRFRGNKLLFVLVIFTMLIPSQTISIPLFSTFRYFDFFGIFEALTGTAIKLTNTAIPTAILSATCLGFRSGLYVILMTQFYRNIPEELTEAAYVDGAGSFKTFFQIILPMARSMMVVIFVLSFAWQWTDTFYANILYSGKELLPNVVMNINSITADASVTKYYISILTNTGALMAIAPLLVIYIIFQRQIIEGIERSGLVG